MFAPGSRTALRASGMTLVMYRLCAMHNLSISRLALTDFRNHAALDLALDARPVCLFGPNGAGKTNIIEALTMLAPGRGLRSASLVEVARAEDSDTRAQPWAVS